MKNLPRPVKALALAAGLAGCGNIDLTESETRLVSGVVVGGVTNALGGNENATAAGVILGYALGGAVSRAQAAGCRFGSRPSGEISFQSTQDGIFLNCPSARPGNSYINELRRDPNWQLVTVAPQQRRTNRNGAPALGGFRMSFAETATNGDVAKAHAYLDQFQGKFINVADMRQSGLLQAVTELYDINEKETLDTMKFWAAELGMIVVDTPSTPAPVLR